MSNYSDTCAGCGADLYNAKELGTSALYNPNGADFDLCMACYWSEDDLINESGNFHPDLLAKYYATFGEKRPKLLNVLTGEMV